MLWLFESGEWIVANRPLVLFMSSILLLIGIDEWLAGFIFVSIIHLYHYGQFKQMKNWYFFVFVPKNRLWHFMQIVSWGDSLHENVKAYFLGKIKKIKSKFHRLKFLPSLLSVTLDKHNIRLRNTWYRFAEDCATFSQYFDTALPIIEKLIKFGMISNLENNKLFSQHDFNLYHSLIVKCFDCVGV